MLDVEIIEMAKNKKVGLIALASQRGSLGQIILGSVAQDVLLQAKCPIIIFYRPPGVRKSKVTTELIRLKGQIAL